MESLFPNFLTDAAEYAKAQAFWRSLWNSIDPDRRMVFGWVEPWLSDDGMRDGNPVFSAHSPMLRKAIRVIQHPPEEAGVEFDSWMDAFGGDESEPDSVSELVIACALSSESAALAVALMTAWVAGSVEVDYGENLNRRGA